jgi:hypothetical protein
MKKTILILCFLCFRLSASALAPDSSFFGESAFFETCIDRFENIETLDSSNHEAVYWWIRARVERGEWPRTLQVINFDYHSDLYATPGDVDRANWAGRLLKEGVVRDYTWIRSRAVPVEQPGVEKTAFRFDPGFLDALPDTKDPVIVSIDLDYFLGSGLRDLPAAAHAVRGEIDRIVSALKSRDYGIIGFNLTHSAHHLSKVVTPRWKDRVVETLAETLSDLLGSVSLKRRVARIDLDRAGGRTVFLDSVGDAVVGFDSFATTASDRDANAFITRARGLPAPFPGYRGHFTKSA